MTITRIATFVFAIWFGIATESLSTLLIGFGFAAVLGIDMYLYGRGQRQ